jgi:ribosomal protein S18 acetylase RimI-like enzyme
MRTRWGNAAIAAAWVGIALGALVAARVAAQPPDPVEAADPAGPTPDLAPSPSGPAQPPDEARLRYYLVQRVDQGHGEYVGWQDQLVSVGDYTTQGTVVQAHYDWRYAATDRHRSGSETREVRFDPATRDYVGRTDLDDYDSTPGSLATWLWIPPTVATGDSVRVLDATLTVLGRETIDVAGATRETIHLQNLEETGQRDDDYGQFSWTATDDYWFDATTGMFLRQLREENDTGTYEGAYAGFRMSLTVNVVDASYAPAVGAVPPPPVLDSFGAADDGASYGGSTYDDSGDGDDVLGWFCLVAFACFLIAFIAMLVRSGAQPAAGGGLPYVTRRLAPGEPTPAEAVGLSPRLGPFLPHLVDVAHRTGNVVVAVTPVGSPTVVGLAIDDMDAKLAAIYTSTADAAEALRRALARDELIAETRFPTLASVRAALAATGKSEPGPYAYNLYESFDVMERSGPLEPLSYDTTVVSRMKPIDLGEVAALAQRVYGVPCDRFVQASLDLDDVAFVARDEEGHIIGFAFATVAGDQARLHTLTVDPDARSRGVGKELYRARLRALADLGVTRVITEVAVNNPAAIEVARQFGMQKVGEMHVQTASAQAAPSYTAVRR